MATPLHYLKLHDIAAKIARQDISSVEVTEHMLNRIGTLEP